MMKTFLKHLKINFRNYFNKNISHYLKNYFLSLKVIESVLVYLLNLYKGGTKTLQSYSSSEIITTYLGTEEIIIVNLIIKNS